METLLGAPAPETAALARLLRRPQRLRTVHQPILDLRTGAVAGFEALARVADWPGRSPEPWFAAAARAGVGPQLEAVAVAGALRARADLPLGQFLSVNVSPEAAASRAVLDLLEDQADLHGVVVELTSTPDPAVPALDDLRGRGLLVAVKVRDLAPGAEPWAPSQVPDLVVVDRRLVTGVHADPVRQGLVRLVLGLADDAGADVLARGLETVEDARWAQRAGARLGQGWLFGRARPGFLAPAASAVAWLPASWDEEVRGTRVGRFALPLASAHGTAGWRAELDAAGRLLRLRSADGREVDGARLVRVRGSLDVPSAARRVLSAGASRRLDGLVGLVDDEGRLLGLADAEAIVAAALDVAAAPDGTGTADGDARHER